MLLVWYVWVVRALKAAVKVVADYEDGSQNYFQPYFCLLIGLWHELLTVSAAVLLSYDSEFHQT